MQDLFFLLKKPFSDLKSFLISFIIAFIGFLSFGVGFIVVIGYTLEAAKQCLRNSNIPLPRWELQKLSQYFIQGLQGFSITFIYALPGIFFLALSAIGVIEVALSKGLILNLLLSELYSSIVLVFLGLVLIYFGFILSLVAIINFLDKQKYFAAFDLSVIFAKTLSKEFLYFIVISLSYLVALLFALVFFSVVSVGLLFLFLLPGMVFYLYPVTLLFIVAGIYKDNSYLAPEFSSRLAQVVNNLFEKIMQVPPRPEMVASSKPKREVVSDSGTGAIFYDELPIQFAGKLDKKNEPYGILRSRISSLDSLIGKKGFEKSSTILVSGGAGTGKTTFALQAIYNNAMNGLRGIYLSFEEQPEKIKLHMKESFGWDFEELEKKGLVSIVKVNPSEIARSLEESVLQKEGGLAIKMKKIELPFYPDVICIDSLSALSIAFDREETYRRYIRELFEALEQSHAVTFVLSETEQNPRIYSRSGVEEFLADGVIVLYNLSRKEKRVNALEILKLRGTQHRKGLVYYKITPTGIEIQD